MSTNTAYWILAVAGLYMAIGFVYGVYWVANEADEATRKTIVSFFRRPDAAKDPIRGWLVLVAVLLWPIWLVINWLGGFEERETEKAIEDFRRSHPEAESPTAADNMANQSPQPTPPKDG